MKFMAKVVIWCHNLLSFTIGEILFFSYPKDDAHHPTTNVLFMGIFVVHFIFECSIFCMQMDCKYIKGNTLELEFYRRIYIKGKQKRSHSRVIVKVVKEHFLMHFMFRFAIFFTYCWIARFFDIKYSVQGHEKVGSWGIINSWIKKLCTIKKKKTFVAQLCLKSAISANLSWVLISYIASNDNFD